MDLPLREFESFFRVTSWGEWYYVTKLTFPVYFVPWLISNLVGVVLLLVAVRVPKIARMSWGFLLILAALANAYVSLTDPIGYLEYGILAIPPMQRFIYSRFFSRPEFLVLPIALCQGLIGIELLFDEHSPHLQKVALASIIIFFFGLTTLGIGSAFPSSLLYAMTMKQCWPTEDKEQINLN